MRIGVNGLTGLSAFFTAHALPRPAETIRCTALHFEAGGKGHNQAVACARLGAACVFVGAVGRDAQAEQCRTVMNKEGVQPLLVDKEEPTAFAAITTAADGENIVQVYPGAAAQLLPEDLLEQNIRVTLESCDVLLMQNELGRECLDTALWLGEKAGIRMVWYGCQKHILVECSITHCTI